jgi:hypothetical protein
LGPLDQALVQLYSGLLVALVTVAAIRWKSIALEWIIKHSSQEKALPMHEEDVQRILLPLDRYAEICAYRIELYLHPSKGSEQQITVAKLKSLGTLTFSCFYDSLRRGMLKFVLAPHLGTAVRQGRNQRAESKGNGWLLKIVRLARSGGDHLKPMIDVGDGL